MSADEPERIEVTLADRSTVEYVRADIFEALRDENEGLRRAGRDVAENAISHARNSGNEQLAQSYVRAAVPFCNDRPHGQIQEPDHG